MSGDLCAEEALELASVTDWTGFSRAIRSLRAQGIAPEDVRWRFAGDLALSGSDLFDSGAARPAHDLPEAPPLRLAKAFVEAARDVFLHADPTRLALLHRMALRVADDPLAWSDTLHPDRLQLDRLQREVRREIHKMHAFVRFRPIAADASPELRHVAWFAPDHHVLEAAAPFFARRFAVLRWAILTPRVCVSWDGRALAYGPGANKADAPGADAGEALWLAYYRSIFNPARVKLDMMKKEMPVRFWKNLPEAATIGTLLAEAPRRAQAMVDAGGALRGRRRGQVEVTSDGEGGGATASGVDDLRRRAARCRDCPVADAATQTVFGEGSAQARLMIVGEQPGDQEDLRGRPFQGPAGQLLQGAFEELGWDARELYLTNAVKHFHHELRGKRRLHKTPGQQEAEACLHWLDAEIAALRPQAIIALGATAARSLLGGPVPVQANEGRWIARADGIPVLVCLHPAAILRADVSRQHALRAHWVDTLRAADAFATVDEAVAP